MEGQNTRVYAAHLFRLEYLYLHHSFSFPSFARKSWICIQSFFPFFFLCADGVVDVCPKKEACSSTTRPGTPIKLCSSVGFLVELEHWFNNKHNRGSSFRLRETKSSYLQSLGVLCCVRRSYPGAPCSAQSTQIIVNLVCA